MFITCPSCLTDNSDGTVSCMVCGTPLVLAESSSTYHLPYGTLLQQRYQIENTLGEGGFGITYKGIHLAKSVKIAIKELWPEKAIRQGMAVTWPHSITPAIRVEQIKNFQLEAEYLSRCVHPHIPKVYEWFEENNTAYIVMEFISGQSLAKILQREGRLAENKVKQYFIQVAEALKVVHSHNLLHRDIKPENVIIDNQDRAVLIDFGATKEFIAGQTSEVSVTLTRGYAPLEQYSYRSKRSPGTDFYALCASMYELLTGELPAAAIDRVHSESLIPPRQLVPHLSVEMEKVILTGMRMQVEERFQTADEFIDALQGELVSLTLRRSRQLVKQHKLAEAILSYEKYLADEPNNGDAAVELALIYIYKNDSQAEAAAKRAILLKPNDGRGYGVLGLVSCRQAKWSAAVKYLEQAAKLSPHESWIQANLAWAIAKFGHWEQAATTVAKALQLDSHSAFALGLQAWIAVNQQQWKSAIRAARLAIAQNNSLEIQRWVYPCLTVALEKAVVTKQGTDVERCIQEFMTQVPDSAFAWGFKGWKQAVVGLWTDAIPHFEQAKRQVQTPGWVFLNLGIAQEHLQNIQEAIQAYEAYNQKFPLDAFIQFRLGTLFAKQSQWLLARSFLEKAVHFQPDYAEAYHNLGWVLLNIKGQDNQVENFRQMWSAYRKAADLYTQQKKHRLAQSIQQTFQLIGIEFEI